MRFSLSKSGRQQPHDVHARDTAVTLELFRCFTRAHVLGQQPRKLGDDEAQPTLLFQVRDLSGDAARILDVLLAIEHLPDPAPGRSGSRGGPRR